MISTKINIDTSEVNKAFNKIESGAKATGKELDNAFKVDVDTKEIDGFFDNVKKQASSVKDSLASSFDISSIMNFSAGGLVTGAVEGAISGIVAGFSSAIEKGNEFNNALLDLQAKTGATASEMKVLEQNAKDLFIGGVGESVAEATRIMGEAQLRLGDVFSGKELTEFTKKANALGKQFDLDVNEVMKKSAPFIKQFGLSGEEAFNLVAMSMKEGTTASDDILDSLAEYSQLTKNAGYSAQQFTDILTRGTKEGIFNTDKLADSIKEAEIRIKAGDFKDAFKGISAGATKAEQALIAPIQAIVEAGNRGELSIQETLQKSTKLIDEAFKGGKISESLASQLQVAVAGTPAEDIGTELFGKIFGAPIDDKMVADKAKQIGDNLSKAVGSYTTLDSIGKSFEVAITSAGKAIVTFTDDTLKFLSPLFNLMADLFDATYITFYSNIFGTQFAIIKDVLMDTWKSITDVVDAFSSLFGEAGEGIDIIGILKTTFEFLGKIVGTFVTIPFQILAKIFQAFLYIIKEVILFVKGLGDRFNEFVKNNKFMQDFIQSLGEKFIKLGMWILDATKKVKGFLQSIGLLSKDKSTKDLNKDLKETKTTAEQITPVVEGTTEAVVKQKKEVKTLQQQYDELYKKTLEIAGNSKFEIEYQTNLKKLQALKEEIEGNNILKLKVDFDLQGGITWDNRNKLINDYLKNDVEVNEVNIRPKELTFALKNIKPIEIENAKLEPTFFDNLEKDISSRIEKSVSGATLNFNNDSYKKAIKELNENTESELNNLSNTLLSANISYEEYSEQKADILRNAKEKEMQIENEHQSNLFANINKSTSELLQSIKQQYDNNFDETLAKTTQNNLMIIQAEKDKNQALYDIEQAKLTNDTKLIAEKQALVDSANKTIIDSTQTASEAMNSIYSTMAISMGASLTDAILQGKNAFDTLIGLAFDFIQKMVPIWSAQILAGSLATPQSIITAGGAGLAQWTAMTILIQGAVSAARAALGFKDGVINLQGPGTGRSDSISARLSKGESVINARSTAMNEPYLRYINNGGDMSKMVSMNMNTKNIENLLYTNNELLKSKNFNPNINNVNKFNVSSKNISIVRGR